MPQATPRGGGGARRVLLAVAAGLVAGAIASVVISLGNHPAQPQALSSDQLAEVLPLFGRPQRPSDKIDAESASRARRVGFVRLEENLEDSRSVRFGDMTLYAWPSPTGACYLLNPRGVGGCAELDQLRRDGLAFSLGASSRTRHRTLVVLAAQGVSPTVAHVHGHTEPIEIKDGVGVADTTQPLARLSWRAPRGAIQNVSLTNMN